MVERPGIFTTLRARAGELWFWPDHLARLEVGAARLRLPVPSPAQLEAEIAARVADLPDARVRITLRAAAEPLVEAAAYTEPRGPWVLRPVPASPDEDTVRLKTTARRVYEDARRAAAGVDDALLVAGGNYLECTVANVFFVGADGRLVTPAAEAPLLAGIARARVLAAAREAGLEAVEAPVDAESAAVAKECFVTNALFLVHSVARIERVGRYDDTKWARRLRNAVVQTATKTRIIP